MKKEILSIITLLLTMQLFSQQSKRDTIPIWEDYFRYKILKSNDILFIDGDSDPYLVSRSPLSSFKGYKKIYKKHNFPEYMPRYFEDRTSTGPYDKEFQCVWLIRDKQLYLTRILFDNVEIDQGRKDQYAIMEQFTGEKFDTRYNDISEGDTIIAKVNERYGLMPVTWFSDTLYVKKSHNYNEPGDQEKNVLDWRRRNYTQMIFKSGKLVKTKSTPNLVEKGYIVKPGKSGYSGDMQKRTPKP
ncbi:hypothetical protein [Proteiniphilum sp.]|uniref:hypothetical protein n=1 Tax=Proteiniphilum sp. TaxID=1926877 RepID=UPI002B20FB7D|nr:hypothetical protein [Proteiniphilum sp.]MEA4917836.1 hypothetical protein [Proteiniphilum sp.]